MGRLLHRSPDVQHWNQLVNNVSGLPNNPHKKSQSSLAYRSRYSTLSLPKTHICAEWKSAEMEAVSVRATSTYSMVLVRTVYHKSVWANCACGTRCIRGACALQVVCRAFREDTAAGTPNVALWSTRHASQRRRFGQQPTHITDRLRCARSSHTSINRAAYETNAASHTYTTRTAIPTTSKISARDETSKFSLTRKENATRLLTRTIYYEYITNRQFNKFVKLYSTEL